MTKEFEKHTEAFLMEARSYIGILNSNLLKLEKDPNDQKSFHEVFRVIHTLKSMAGIMEYNETARLCHNIEDLLDAVRNQQIDLKSCIDLLFSSFDFLSAQLKLIESGNPEQDSKEECLKCQALLKSKKKINPKKPKKSENHNISKNQETSKNPEINKKDETKENGFLIEKLQSIEVKIDRLDILLKLVEELLVDKLRLELLRDTLDNNTLDNSKVSETVKSLSRTIDELQYNVMKIRMVPISFVFNQFPRMIRDLAKKQNKEVNLKITGDTIELDRAIIDEVSESLVHLIRNAIDHGLETKVVREKLNKPSEGEIQLSAFRNKESVVIEVSDDGAGLDEEKIRKVGITKGILSKEDTQEKVQNAIFEDISTASFVSDVSGRGLGLNIVKEKVESIDGTISVKSKPGHGTTFKIEIPLSLAVIKALFVKVLNNTYAIPVANIDRLVTIPRKSIKSSLNIPSIILEGNMDVPITRLRSLFGNHEQPDPEIIPIVVVQKGQERIGLVVDALLTTQEIVVKPLTRFVKENRFFGGTALIGSGEIVLVLDVSHLILSSPIYVTPEIKEMSNGTAR